MTLTSNEQMFKPTRLVATGLFLGSIVMVFVSAFVLGIDALVILFAVTTYLVRLIFARPSSAGFVC